MESDSETLGTRQTTDRERVSWLVMWVPVGLIFALTIVNNYQARFAKIAADASAVEAPDESVVSGGRLDRQLVFLAFGGLGGILLLAGPRSPTGVGLPAIMLMLVVGFIGLGILASEDTGTSVRKSIPVFLCLVGGLGIGRHWTMKELCHIAFFVSGFLIGVSLLLELKEGTFLGSGEYRFSGLFHPNRQAVVSSILVIAGFSLFYIERKFLSLAGAIVGVLCVMLTGSRGGLISATIGCAAVFTMSLSAQRRLLLFFAICSFLVVGLFFAEQSGMTVARVNLDKMGRQSEGNDGSTLTGRIPIWQECVKAIKERPLLGYGYGTFWTPGRIDEFFAIHDWSFSNAHSCYLETALNVGLIGLFAGLGLIISSIFVSANQVKKGKKYYLFFIGLLVAGMANGLVEAIFVRPGLAAFLVMIGVGILIFEPKAEGPGSAGRSFGEWNA